MIDENDTKIVLSVIVLISLLILSVFILKPIMISIISALLLAFIFSPVYNLIYKATKSKNLSASIIIIFLMLIIILPIWFFTPILIKQSFEVFQLASKVDFTKLLNSFLPTFFASEQFSTEIGITLSSFTKKLANNMVHSFAEIILNFPAIMLNLTVVFFTFFFVLRDKEIIVTYLKNVLPFSKEVVEKLFEYSRGITSSILYGQLIIGFLQGIIFGIGLFIFGIPKALLLTLLTIIIGILPIIGPFIVWLPLTIYLFSTQGPTITSFGILFFGVIASSIDNYLRPLIVSRRTKIHSAILLISMIGGLFFFGILGLILGPLIISYLLVFLEIYKGKSKSIFLIEQPSK